MNQGTKSFRGSLHGKMSCTTHLGLQHFGCEPKLFVSD